MAEKVVLCPRLLDLLANGIVFFFARYKISTSEGDRLKSSYSCDFSISPFGCLIVPRRHIHTLYGKSFGRGALVSYKHRLYRRRPHKHL